MKYKWEIDKPPTGLTRVCYRRRWPTAYYSNGRICAMIVCSVDYHIQGFFFRNFDRVVNFLFVDGGQKNYLFICYDIAGHN